ncbi:mitochondrial F1-F0 ATP synthase subunit F of fungi-domain-containing protein [Daldinia bambusicola]|nr:mitochondrial F1-F0 ATP synthase subunit F of fungi-domain-containing protein [Daldinia bambusicola]
MSFVTRRALSTLIPPKVASPSAIGTAPDALRMKRVVSFYEKLPRGPAPEIKPTGLLGRYQAKHFGKNPTAKRTSPNRFALIIQACRDIRTDSFPHSYHSCHWFASRYRIPYDLLLPPT